MILMKRIIIYIVSFMVLVSCQSRTERIREEFDRVERSLGDTLKPTVMTGGKELFMLTRQMNSLNLYIDSLKEALKTSSLAFTSGKKGEEELADTETSERIMINGKQADTLYNRLKDFETATVASFVSGNEKVMPEGFPYIQVQNTKEAFSKAYFGNIPTVAALTMLSSFQLKIKKDFDAVFQNHIKK